MRCLLLIFGLGVLVVNPTPAASPEGKPGVAQGELIPAPEDFDQRIRDYLRAKFQGKAEPFYCETVTLLPGHEFLKAEHGIVGEGKRSVAATATKEQMVKVDKSDALTVPPDRVDALLARMEITSSRVEKDGVFKVEGSDGEGELEMPARKGDVAIVARFAGVPDGLAFLLRQSDGAWKVAAEYLD